MLNIFCYQCYNRHSLCPVATGLYITGANCFPISRDYLRDHPYLACDDTCGYLTLWCVNLEVQEVSPQLVGVSVGVCACVRAVHVCLWVWVCGSVSLPPPPLHPYWSCACLQKTSLMKRVAHQAIVMQYIMELSKQLKRDPRSCVPGFFER